MEAWGRVNWKGKVMETTLGEAVEAPRGEVMSL